MSKKLSSFEDLANIAFKNLAADPIAPEKLAEEAPFKKQVLEAHFSNKGRGGKTVTVIKGFKGTTEALKTLAGSLKKSLSVGGTVKNNEIIIQGNFRNAIMKSLVKMGHEVKRIGG